MIACPFCKTPNETGAEFCGNCGKPLAGVATDPGSAASGSTAAPKASAPTSATAAVVPPPAPLPANETAAPKQATTWPASAVTGAAPSAIVCPNCGETNHPSREFCWKCASDLHPKPPPKPPSPFGRSFWISFGLSSLVGLAVVVGGAQLLAPKGAETPITLARSNGDPVQFAVSPGTPQPLPNLPTDSTIQLASYKQAVAQASGTPGNADFKGRPPWWNDNVPRVPPVSQFDGGPLAKVNCVMASGAMLARLAYGIVTSGTQLRGLQDDQANATNYADLGTAVRRGWGVKFFKGDLSPLELRALLWAGAGAVIGVVYGQIPVGVRLQESFTGNHSIYIDAFRPAGPDGPAAYYVMDPIGHTWAGYKGGWWPAEDVERAAKAHSAGRISATWAFAGGVVPKNHPILPRDAYPKGPGESPVPTLEPSTGPSQAPADPMPNGDTVLLADPGIGDPPPDIPIFLPADFVTNLYLVDPNQGAPACATVPPPPGCPIGIVGIADFGAGIPIATPQPSPVTLLYANPIAIGTYQIIFSAPPNTQQALWLWNSAGGGALVQQPVEQGLIGGNPVSISTITVDPTGNFSFIATATGDGTSASSTVGSLVVSQQ